MVVAIETISAPKSRLRRLFRSGMRNFCGGSAKHTAALPNYSKSRVPGSEFPRSHSGAARHRNLIIDHCSLVIERSTVAWQGKQGYQFESTLGPAGLQYVRQRWYDPATRQFISPDPLRFAGGDVNLFRYAGNNPVNVNDPSGMAKTPRQMPGQLAQAIAVEEADTVRTEPLLEEFYALQLAASQLFPIGAFHIPWPSAQNRIAQIIQASVGRLNAPPIFGPAIPYKLGESPSLWQQQLTQARHAFARGLNITEFELYQTLEAEGRTAQANAYAAAMAQTIYGEIELSNHPSHFLTGRYVFWEDLLQNRQAILNFFRRFPNARYGAWPRGTYIISPGTTPQANYVYGPKAIVISRPPSALAEQIALAWWFSKYTGGAKPLPEHEEYDLGPESDKEGGRTQTVVSGGVSILAPAARAAQQFLTAPSQITVKLWATRHDAGYYLLDAPPWVNESQAKTFLVQWAGIPWSDLK